VTNLPINEIICRDWIKVLKSIPDNTVHCVCTSPPYWGQRIYAWGSDGSCYDEKTKTEIHNWQIDHELQICERCGAKAPTFGLEKTPEEHIEKLVEGFREVRRVLRPDGVLWLNYGDKYWGGKGQSAHGGSVKQRERFEHNQSINKQYQEIGCPGWTAPGDGKHDTLGSGDLIMLPARVALALQADGWILRDAIIWAKAISSFGMHVCPYCGKELYQQIGQGRDLFGGDIEDEIINHKKSGSTMPESVNGWRWERHRIKVKSYWNKDNPHPS
jgi:DNA modification methylase